MLFLFTATAHTVIYTLSLHDALPIWFRVTGRWRCNVMDGCNAPIEPIRAMPVRLGCIFKETYRPSFEGTQVGALPVHVLQDARSEEHTSELQSHSDLVCRLLLEKKNK